MGVCQGHGKKRTAGLRNSSTSRRNVSDQSAACIPLWSQRPRDTRKISFMGSCIWKKAQSLGLPATVRWTLVAWAPRLTEPPVPTPGPTSWPGVHKWRDVSVLPKGSALPLLRLVLPTSTLCVLTLWTPLLVADGKRDWQQLLSSAYLLSFWQGCQVTGYLAPNE